VIFRTRYESEATMSRRLYDPSPLMSLRRKPECRFQNDNWCASVPYAPYLAKQARKIPLFIPFDKGGKRGIWTFAPLRPFAPDRIF
jgi:hypothetical protein